MIYWTCRNISRNRWQFEDGSEDRAKAERSAKFYRREYNRRCVVVPVPKGELSAKGLTALREVLGT